MSEQIVIGIDPGVERSHAVAMQYGDIEMSFGFDKPCTLLDEIGSMYVPAALSRIVCVLEFPEFQGQRRVQKSLVPLTRTATLIGSALHEAMHTVYIPPANEIRRLMGWTPSQGKADPWISLYLEDYYGGRTSMFVRYSKFSSDPQAGFLSNDHKRDSCFAALWYLEALSRQHIEYRDTAYTSAEYLELFLWRGE